MTAPSHVANVLRAERLSVLSTPAARLLLVASMLMAALSGGASLLAVDDITTDASLQLAMHSSTVATMVFALVGGLYSSTTDHRFGLVDQRLLSQPNRAIVLLAKAAISGVVGLVYGLLGAATAAGITALYFRSQAERLEITDPLVTRALLGIVLAAPLFAVIGVAVGTLVRSQPAAIGGTLAWILMAEPAALVGLPNVGKWLPGSSGLALTFSPDEALLDQTAGGLLLLAYVALVLFAAVASFRNADL